MDGEKRLLAAKEYLLPLTSALRGRIGRQWLSVGCIAPARARDFKLRVRAFKAHALFVFFFYIYIFIYIFRAQIIRTRGSRASLKHLCSILAE